MSFSRSPFYVRCIAYHVKMEGTVLWVYCEAQPSHSVTFTAHMNLATPTSGTVYSMSSVF